jgi:Na+/H+ antiporter NhaD/arsenite permease-like protein
MRWVVLAVFSAVYVYLCVGKHWRNAVMWGGIAAIVACGYALGDLGPDRAISPWSLLTDSVSWNVIGVLAGAMMIADLFRLSRVPVLLADLIVDRCRTANMALLGVCALAGAVSAFVDNVTTVLLIAPVAFVVAGRAGLSPVPFLIGMACAANLQGAATLIGDPPSMMLAGFYKLSFNDFFVRQGRPSIFFAIQAGAVAAFVVLYFIFRRHSHAVTPIEVERPKTWAPTVFIGAMVAFLASASYFDPGFVWLAGTGNVLLGLVALGWAARFHRDDARQAIRDYNVPTVFFLTGIFVVTYMMERFGWVRVIADGVAAVVGKNEFAAYTLIVWISVLVSAFIDNIAYCAIMLPVTKALGESVGGPPFLYAAGLLIGTCLGGNITPIGASCNVVAVGLLRREGHHVSFWQFARIGLPFTTAATLAGYLFVWVFWH